jgi:hypothetical protein
MTLLMGEVVCFKYILSATRFDKEYDKNSPRKKQPDQLSNSQDTRFDMARGTELQRTHISCNNLCSREAVACELLLVYFYTMVRDLDE